MQDRAPPPWAFDVLPAPRRNVRMRGSLTSPQQSALDIVKEEPGCSIRRVAIRLRVSHATASYHLFALAKMGLIVQVREGRELRHFAGTRAPEEEEYLGAFLRDPAKAAVLRLLAQATAHLTIHQVAKALGMPFGTVKRTLNQFEALDLIVLERRHFRYSVRINPVKREAIATALGVL